MKTSKKTEALSCMSESQSSKERTELQSSKVDITKCKFKKKKEEDHMRSKNMMTIEELVKTGKMESSIEFPLKRLTVVNVGFLNNDEEEEETQLTLEHSPLTKEGIKELKELFGSLTKEFNTKANRVTYIHIVATAQTEAELEAMGY